MSERDDWISATEVASFVYCAEAWRLEHGLGLGANNERARARGERTHERWQRTEKRSAWLIRAAAICLAVALLLWILQGLL